MKQINNLYTATLGGTKVTEYDVVYDYNDNKGIFVLICEHGLWFFVNEKEKIHYINNDYDFSKVDIVGNYILKTGFCKYLDNYKQIDSWFFNFQDGDRFYSVFEYSRINGGDRYGVCGGTFIGKGQKYIISDPKYCMDAHLKEFVYCDKEKADDKKDYLNKEDE